MVVIKVCFQQNPILQTSNGPIAGDPFQTGTFEMHGSTQGEVFFKTRVKAEARIVMWMGKSIPLQLSLRFGGFPTLEQSQRHSSSSSYPNEPWSGAFHRQSLLAPAEGL